VHGEHDRLKTRTFGCSVLPLHALDSGCDQPAHALAAVEPFLLQFHACTHGVDVYGAYLGEKIARRLLLIDEGDDDAIDFDTRNIARVEEEDKVGDREGRGAHGRFFLFGTNDSR